MQIMLDEITTCQRMINYVTGEIEKQTAKGNTGGTINLSLDLTRPEKLHFYIIKAGKGKVIYLNLTKGSCVVHASSRADYENPEEVEEAIESVLGYSRAFVSGITRTKARKIQEILRDNGIDSDETATVAQAIGYVLGEEWETLLDWDF